MKAKLSIGPLIAGLCLFGCSGPGQAPSAGNAALDGEYQVTMELIRPAHTGAICPPGDGTVRIATVRGGQFSLVYNPSQNAILAGPVGPDGAVRAEGWLRTSRIRFTGQIRNGGVNGEAASDNCIYRVAPRSA